MSCPPRPLRARPHPLRSPIPACRRFFPALRRPRSPCGLSLRPPASSARPNPARRGFCPPPVFACAPREGRILAGSQRVPCPPRHPARPPAFPVRPIPACRRFFPALCRPRPLRGLSLPDAGSVCRVVLRAAARVIRTALSLRAAGFVRRVALRAPVFACVPRDGRILAGSQRVPCPPRRPARASASTAQSYPCLTPAFSCVPPPASPVRPIPARRGFCPPPVLPALRGKGGYWK